MINRLGACGDLCWSSGAGAYCSGWLALVKIHLQRKVRCGLVKWLRSPLGGIVLPTEVGADGWGMGNCITLLSCPQRGEFKPAAVQETLTEEHKISSSCVPGFCQNPAFILCLCHLPPWWCKAPVFHLRCTAGFQKLQILGTWIFWSSGGGSPHVVASAGLSQISSIMIVPVLGIYDETQPEADFQVSFLQEMPLLLS